MANDSTSAVDASHAQFPRLTRRDLLRTSAGTLLAAGIWPGRLSAEDTPATEAFHFVALNDLHYVDAKSGPWLEKVTKQIKEHKEQLDFCLIAGDFAEKGTKEELAPVKEIFDALKLPYYVVPGNHDHQAMDDRAAYNDLFPKSINYQFEHRGWQFVALDTSEGTKYENTKIGDDTLRWVDDTLPKLDRKKPTIILTHFPMGPSVTYRPKNADDLLDRFREFNVPAVFCGHFHGFTERKVRDSIITTNKCCAISRNNHDNTREKGYFLCKAENGAVQRTFVEVKPEASGSPMTAPKT